jgi:hypothetical protein
LAPGLRLQADHAYAPSAPLVVPAARREHPEWLHAIRSWQSLRTCSGARAAIRGRSCTSNRDAARRRTGCLPAGSGRGDHPFAENAALHRPKQYGHNPLCLDRSNRRTGLDTHDPALVSRMFDSDSRMLDCAHGRRFPAAALRPPAKSLALKHIRPSRRKLSLLTGCNERRMVQSF